MLPRYVFWLAILFIAGYRCSSIPHLTSVHTALTAPVGLVNQIPEDANRLKFHQCYDEGEAYSASFLVTKKHFISKAGRDYRNLSMEGASFKFMETDLELKYVTSEGAVMQSLDIMDLSVVHLSAYERSLRYKNMYDEAVVARRMEEVADDLQERGMLAARTNRNPLNSLIPDLNETLVLLPWAGSVKGVGNSDLSHRATYLRACFWSFYYHYENIVVAVHSEKDKDEVRDRMKLPVSDIWVFPDEPIDLLPHALISRAQHTIEHFIPPGSHTWPKSKKRSMKSKYDNIKYILYSESDQILLMRDAVRNRQEVQELYDLLKVYPHAVLVPHRLMPYADELLKKKRSKGKKSFFGTLHSSIFPVSRSVAQIDLEQASCCLPRQNCRNRKKWVGLRHEELQFLRIFGMSVAMGNANFRAERFRPCSLKEWDKNALCS